MEYFIPTKEDIKIGYECETQVNPYPNWVKTIIKDGDCLNFIINKDWQVRVPYLTKEQIEAEGWLYKGKTQDIWFEKELDYDMGSWTAYKVVIQYGINDKRLRIFAVDRVDKLDYDCFIGECKDINTFRYICKLLKIN